MAVEVAIASAVAIYVMTAPSSIGDKVPMGSAAAISNGQLGTVLFLLIEPKKISAWLLFSN